MAFFNNSPFWNFYNNLDKDYFEPFDTSISPRLLGSKQTESNDNKFVAKKDPEQDRATSLFRPFFDDSLFKPDFDIVPPVDLIEKEDKYELHASIPGVPKEQINLDYNNDNKELTISGTVPEVNIEKNEKDKHYKELRSGSFERKVRFGTSVAVDGEKISAGYKNGILTITVPKVAAKKEKENVRKIQIGEGNPKL